MGGDDFILYGLGEQVVGWWGGFSSLVCWTYFMFSCLQFFFVMGPEHKFSTFGVAS